MATLLLLPTPPTPLLLPLKKLLLPLLKKLKLLLKKLPTALLPKLPLKKLLLPLLNNLSTSKKNTTACSHRIRQFLFLSAYLAARPWSMYLSSVHASLRAAYTVARWSTSFGRLSVILLPYFLQ